ncbi:HlyD family efflux transporter periplasmic adaptor subunit [Carnobacterium divergens]|uniref:HlyD family efflux transporter periplasmic adaptor subunit n=1 Tax=Carnobacterium divergens TaxID=2748 RepID=A0AAW8R5G4_CARDV|nr:HlyD family efflux transporter periplasmic adaptor subunit [Carnobacterium divergens]MDT1956929.1 HlyD family efflux transporter periplasmic adaptor subunit [Carnobacterium divergens]MDT1972899.1 HlyD family efflux transporter periplasmic adaptor subunit [Carnobacterium divergens]
MFAYKYYFNTQKSAEEEIIWREYPVTQDSIISYFDGTGKITLQEETYTREMWMMVQEIFVKEGQEVTKGQPILKNTAGGVIEAESDGVIKKIHAEKNKEVAYKNPLVTVGNYEKKSVKLAVSQEDINSVVIGQKIKLNFLAERETELEAEVTEINSLPKEGADTIQYVVTAKLAPTDLKLREGMTGTAKFIRKSVDDVLVLSNKAIELKDGKQFVLVRDNANKIKKITIKTGFSDGRVSEVVEGLKDGDVVVVKG